jgi:hypothetical protein
LSQTGLFANASTLTPAPGLVEYKVNSPLWSDGARKRRWIALPGTQQIDFSAGGNWSFPVGTAFVKHFELPVTPSTVRRVETRVFLRQVDRWVGYTYRWNAAQTDATLLTDAARTFRRPGRRPHAAGGGIPRPGSASAATNAAGSVLGARRTAQPGADYAQGSDQQLHAWGLAWACSTRRSEIRPAIRSGWIRRHGALDRGRSLLPGSELLAPSTRGAAPGSMDMRAETAVEAMNLIGVTPTFGDLGIAGAQRIRSGSKAQSVLWQRVRSTDPAVHMPQVSRVPDPLAVSLLGAWIDSAPAGLDSDGDGVTDANDNCPFAERRSTGQRRRQDGRRLRR